MNKIKSLLIWMLVTVVIFLIFFLHWYKFGMVYDFKDWARYEASLYLGFLVWWTLFVPSFLALAMTNLSINPQNVIRQKSRVSIFRGNVVRGIRDAVIFVVITGVMGLLRLPFITMNRHELGTFLLLWLIQLVTAFISLTMMHIFMMFVYNYTNRRWLALLITSSISIILMASTRLPVELPWQYYAIITMIGDWPNMVVLIPYFMIIIWIVMILGIYLIGESKAKWLTWYR